MKTSYLILFVCLFLFSCKKQMPDDFEFVYSDPIDSINTFSSCFSRQYWNDRGIDSTSTIHFKLSIEQKEKVYNLLRKYEIDRFDYSNELLKSEEYLISINPKSCDNYLTFILNKKKHSFGYTIKIAVLMDDKAIKRHNKRLAKQCENLINFDIEMRNLFRELKKEVKLSRTNLMLI